LSIDDSSNPRGDLSKASIDTLNSQFLSLCYASASATPKSLENDIALLPVFDLVSSLSASAWHTLGATPDTLRHIFAGTKKKYKPVHLKVRPVKTELPREYRITRDIKGDPLASLPVINYARIPDFAPTGRYTTDRMQKADDLHGGNFLWPEERRLLHYFYMLHNNAFAWTDDERGRFREDFFPPVEFPVVPHTPWVERNMPIPPGIYEECCAIIREKMNAGVYEPSNATYRSRWFPVRKKNGALRPVHSLEPLNRVTIQHSGVPPIPEHLAETFGGRACGGILDLFVGYDNRPLAEDSRDMTTFQTPFGAMRLTTLPMGWTNSVPIFHDDVTHILQPEIPHVTIPYIDDVPVRGPPSQYFDSSGRPAVIKENPGIRQFVREHFDNLNRVVTRMRYSGGTFSGVKSTLIAEEYSVVGYRCTPAGRVPEVDRVQAIRDWGPCKSLSEVRAFLGTVGVLRIFIRNFARRAHHLVKLTRKDAPFEWGEEQEAAQEDLKQAVIESPALRALDYSSSAPIILAVDTSYIAIGYLLAQCDPDNPRARFYSRFGSITLNDREARFSQPKLELYGVYRTLKALKLYLIGVRNLIVEVDAQHIKGMLQNPDLAPSASINRWISAILSFHFTLVHVPGERHGPDGLSRRPRQPKDPAVPEDDDDEELGPCFLTMHFWSHLVPRLRPTAMAFAQVEATTDPPLDYALCPRTKKALDADGKLSLIPHFLETLEPPSGLSEKALQAFIRFATKFFTDSGRLWKRDDAGAHKLVLTPDRRLAILRDCHDRAAHRGVFATGALISERFWWPFHLADVAWYVRTCHLCQIRQKRQILIPPTVAQPAPLFAKVYMDTMHLPPSAGFKYLVQGRDSLSHWPEFRNLRSETGKTIGDWIYEEILCRWGTLSEIVSDNGTAFVKAIEYLAKRYHVHHIRISGYNSRANGQVERAHYDVRQALFKAADGDPSKWSQVSASVFWSERVTTRKRMGCSPYFAATGTHPIIPLDIVEATYLQPPPDSVLSTTDLISRRAIALQKRREHLRDLRDKVVASRKLAAQRFEQENYHTIRDFDFKRGSLVLIRNTAIEKALNRKMRARYLGPLIVVLRNRGGAYVLCELDGTVLDRPVAAFRVIPYLARQSIPLPDNFLDITPERLRAMGDSESLGDDDLDDAAAAAEDDDDRESLPEA
jgi:hypothetical protein